MLASKKLLKRIDTRNYLTEREHREYLNVIERDLEVLDLIKKLCKKEDNYLNTDFNNKLYIDGCIEYENEEQKKLVEEWLDDNANLEWIKQSKTQLENGEVEQHDLKED